MTQLPTASMIGDEEADIKMNFNFDVVDDVRAKVEALVQKSTLGRFDGAREIIDSIVDGPEGEDFVIAFEVLRLLYDQGQFQQLREVIEKLSRRRPLPTSESTMPSEAWSVQESDVLKLMDMVALVSMDCNKRFGFREPLKKPPQASISQRLRNLRLKALDDEDVISAVLLMRLMYIEHELGNGVSSDDFKILLGHSPPALVSLLLRDEYFWAAEKVLEVCFRREEPQQHSINLEVIWEAIAWFLDDTTDNRTIWIRIAILQTFCEGCSRQGFADTEFDVLRFILRSWHQGMEMLSHLILGIEKSNWVESRAFIRHELLMHDNLIWLQMQRQRQPLNLAFQTASELDDLLNLARKNDDDRYQAGIQWRIDVSNNQRSTHDPLALVAVPYNIYTARRQ